MTITPTADQADAIREIVEWYGESGRQEFYLAGYAGVGKSTIARFAIAELVAKYGITRTPTGTYTGKAANVLRRKGVENAQTLHSMIYTPRQDPVTGNTKWTLNRSGPGADADLITVDEVSMVPDAMADDLRSFGKKILVMGDPGQLPPVKGAGAFTNRKPDVFLTEVRRQAADSPIIRLATMARRGEPIEVGDYGDGVKVLVLDAETQDEAYRTDTQPICGVHRVRWTITQRLRRRLGHVDEVPENGERVICCRNNSMAGIFNGQQGTSIAEAEELEPGGDVVMSIALDDLNQPLEEVPVSPYLFRQHFAGPSERPRIRRDVHEFDWGYVLTCHKAQGSEWPHVTVIDDSGAFRDDRDRWLYTAITRASEGLTILKRGN